VLPLILNSFDSLVDESHLIGFLNDDIDDLIMSSSVMILFYDSDNVSFIG
jgi:hypothetical protein